MMPNCLWAMIGCLHVVLEEIAKGFEFTSDLAVAGAVEEVEIETAINIYRRPSL